MKLLSLVYRDSRPLNESVTKYNFEVVTRRTVECSLEVDQGCKYNAPGRRRKANLKV